jgi:hypothetical protein
MPVSFAALIAPTQSSFACDVVLVVPVVAVVAEPVFVAVASRKPVLPRAENSAMSATAPEFPLLLQRSTVGDRRASR